MYNVLLIVKKIGFFMVLMVCLCGCEQTKDTPIKKESVEKAHHVAERPIKKWASGPDLVLSVQPCWEPEKILLMYRPLANYLSKTTGFHVKLVISDNYKQFHQKLFKTDIALQDAYSTYTHIESGVMLLPVAIAVSKNGSTEERGAVIVRAESAIRDLHDLVGKSFIFGAIHNTPKFFSAWILLKKAGLDPPRDFPVMAIGGECSANAMAVFVGDYDAGAVCADFLEETSRQDLRMGLRVVAYTDPSPNWFFTIRKNLDPSIKAAIKKACLELRPDSELAEKVLMHSVWSGFVETKGDELEKIGTLAVKYQVPSQRIFDGFQSAR